MVRQHACFAGVDWASETHHVCVVSADGAKREERTFRHGGAGLAEMAEWIAAKSGGFAPYIPVAIEVPHGPVVESLMDRGFAVYAITRSSSTGSATASRPPAPRTTASTPASSPTR